MALTLLSLSALPPARASISSLRCSLNFSMASSVSTCSSPLAPSFSVQFSLASSFFGFSSGGLTFNNPKPNQNNRLIVRMAKKFQLGQTKRNKSRKSLARVHGFRIRMRSPGGRKVLKRRRDKGRKVLCPKTHANGGKRHMGYGRRKNKMRR